MRRSLAPFFAVLLLLGLPFPLASSAELEGHRDDFGKWVCEQGPCGFGLAAQYPGFCGGTMRYLPSLDDTISRNEQTTPLTFLWTLPESVPYDRMWVDLNAYGPDPIDSRRVEFRWDSLWIIVEFSRGYSGATSLVLPRGDGEHQISIQYDSVTRGVVVLFDGTKEAHAFNGKLSYLRIHNGAEGRCGPIRELSGLGVEESHFLWTGGARLTGSSTLHVTASTEFASPISNGLYTFDVRDPGTVSTFGATFHRAVGGGVTLSIAAGYFSPYTEITLAVPETGWNYMVQVPRSGGDHVLRVDIAQAAWYLTWDDTYWITTPSAGSSAYRLSLEGGTIDVTRFRYVPS